MQIAEEAVRQRLDLRAQNAAMIERLLTDVEERQPALVVEDESRNRCSCGAEMLFHPSSSVVICPACSFTKHVVDAVGTPNNNQTTEPPKAWCDKRLAFALEWLSCVQGKETRPGISTKDIQRVRAHLGGRTVLTVAEVRTAMKQLKLKSQHAAYVMRCISTLPPPQLTRAQESAVRRMFLACQTPFELIRRDVKRSNFISYPYVLSKICELLGFTWMLASFPMLTGAPNLKRTEEIWSLICRAMRWPFTPTYRK